MHKRRQLKILFALLTITLGIIVSEATVVNVGAQSTFQTWNMVVTSGSGSHSGTLNVLSDGDFTSSGFTGSTSQGSYDISVTGWMSGSTVTFTETASYDNGNGYIYGSGTGNLNADFPDATSGSGTVSGTISDPLGERSFSLSWTATKTSGGNGGGSGGNNSFDSSFFGTMAPFFAVIAVVVVVLAVLMVIRHNASSKRANNKTQGIIYDPVQKGAAPRWRASRPEAPQYGQPTPPDMQGVPPPPISMDYGVPISGPGASVATPDLGSLPFLNAVWSPGLAKLTWGTPQFDQSKYALLGYNISQQTFGPQSTAAQNVLLRNVPANVNSTDVNFNQTFRWNTGGDIAGFRVDPVFGQITPQGQIISQFPHGGLGVQIGQPFGTFGVGP